MQRLFRKSIAHPWVSIGIGAALSVALGTGILELRIDNTTSGMFPANDPEVDYWHNVQTNFTPDPDLVAIVPSEELFDADTLREVRQLANRLAEVFGIREERSLFSIEAMRSETLTYRGQTVRRLVPAPLLDPNTARDPSSLRDSIRSEPLLRGNFINESGSAMAIHLFLDQPDKSDGGFEERTVGAVEGVIESFGGGPASDAYLFGRTFVKAAVTESIWRNLIVLAPIAIAVVALLILVFFRAPMVVPIPLITGGLSVLATLGLMGFLGIAINPISSTVVVLLLVIGCSEDIHLISEYAQGIRNGLSRLDAVRAIGPSVGLAALLATLTTSLGFLAIVPNPIPQLREFALVCAVAVPINFVITILVVPALLRLLPVPRSFRPGSGWIPALTSQVTAFLLRLIHRRVPVIAAFLLASILSAVGISRLEVNTDYLRFFPSDSFVNSTADRFARDFGGTSAFSVAVETGQARGVYQLDSLRQLNEFSDQLKEYFTHSLGVTDLIRKVLAERTESPDLPASQEELDAVTTLIPRFLLEPFVDHDGSRALIRLRSDNSGSEGLRADREIVTRLASEVLPPEFTVRTTGEILLLHRFADQVTGQLAQGLLLLLAAILVVFFVTFKSVRFCVIGILSNVFPALVTLGFMGWAGIPLSIGTFSIAIIALGISTDDSIHFLVRYRHEIQSGCEPATALTNTFVKELRPIVLTTIALTAGFLVLGFSSLLLHQEAAVVYAVAFLAALLADLLLLPSLLVRHKPISQHRQVIVGQRHARYLSYKRKVRQRFPPAASARSRVS